MGRLWNIFRAQSRATAAGALGQGRGQARSHTLTARCWAATCWSESNEWDTRTVLLSHLPRIADRAHRDFLAGEWLRSETPGGAREKLGVYKSAGAVLVGLAAGCSIHYSIHTRMCGTRHLLFFSRRLAMLPACGCYWVVGLCAGWKESGRARFGFSAMNGRFLGLSARGDVSETSITLNSRARGGRGETLHGMGSNRQFFQLHPLCESKMRSRRASPLFLS